MTHERALTLRRRTVALTLPERDLTMTLRRRGIATALSHRHISGGATAGNLARHAILQGFCYGGSFNTRVFLLYGLVGDLYDDVPASTLTLRRRKIALTLGG